MNSPCPLKPSTVPWTMPQGFVQNISTSCTHRNKEARHPGGEKDSTGQDYSVVPTQRSCEVDTDTELQATAQEGAGQDVVTLDHRNRVYKETETIEGGKTKRCPEVSGMWGTVRAKCSVERLRALKRFEHHLGGHSLDQKMILSSSNGWRCSSSLIRSRTKD